MINICISNLQMSICLLTFFREIEESEREREKHPYEREAWIDCLLYALDPELQLIPRFVS